MNPSPAQTDTEPVKPHLDLWVLALLLAFPSTGFIQKHAGLGGVAAFVVVVIGLVIVTASFTRRFAPWLEQHFRWLAALAITGLAAGFLILHPFEDGRGPGKSSDRDEGLEMAVTRLAQSETPYYPSNRVAGPLSVLPGSILLAAPFVALGNSGYQNVFWLAAFLFAASGFLKNKPAALYLLTIPLAVSVAAQYEFVSGGDLIANGIFVALFFLFALTVWENPSSSGWRRWPACLLVGVALASRANFLLLIPLFSAAVWRAGGVMSAFKVTNLTLATTAAIILPFYLNDPAGFSPLGSRNKLSFADDSLPWASTAMIGLTILTAGLSAWWLLKQRTKEPKIAFFRCCTLVTLTPMLCAVVVSTWMNGSVDFGIMKDRFGLMYVFFALLGWGGCMRSDRFFGGAASTQAARE
jgi:hypothetical protein